MKSWLIIAAVAAGLAGCSGGGSTGCGGGSVPIGGGGSASAPAGSCGTQSPTVTASDLIVTVHTNSVSGIQNTGTDTATVTVTAVDASRNVLAAIPVSIVPDETAVATTSGTTTDSSGVVTGTISLGGDRSNRTIAVVVTSGSISKIVQIPVVGAKITAAPSPALVTAGQAGVIQYRVVDANAAPMSGIDITVSGSLPSVTGTTDANGNYAYTYTVPEGTAPLTFSAAGAGVSVDTTVSYATTTTVPPAVGVIRSASLAANPSTIGINVPGSTANQVEVRALFLTDNNKPMQNVRVRFDLKGDVNGIGGTLTSGDNFVYSDANGVARTTYVAGSRSSGTDGVRIRACYDNIDFPIVTPATADCPNGKEVISYVTVADEAVSLSINTDNTIVAIDGEQVYQIAFSVQVVDSVGNPKPGILVKGDARLPRYYKGFYDVAGSAWTRVAAQACDNEDINDNHNIDKFSNGQSEDANGDGKLQPAAADVEIVPKDIGTDTTDRFGRAYFYMQYGQNKATWDDYQLTFTATVGGSEGSQFIIGNLPAPAALFTQTTVDLPFRLSPYGTDTSGGTLQVTDPSTQKSGQLCVLAP